MVLLDVISEVELFLDVFATVYVLAILIYVLSSWIKLPYSLRPVQNFFYELCEPYIRLWRRILPSMGPIDLSPMVAVIALIVAERIAVAILERFH
jgi:YggT family protein